MSATPSFNSASAKWLPQKPNISEINLWLMGNYSLAKCVKHNSKRSVYALYSSPQAAPSYYLKHDHPNENWDTWRSRLRPKVLGEFRMLAMLHEKGIPAVLPVVCGWSSGQGILATIALNDSLTIEDLWPQVREDEKRRVILLKGLAILLKSMLEAKIFHPDLHFGNILALEKENVTRCALVDVHGVKVRRKLFLSHKMIMLRMLAGLVHYINHSEIKTLLQPLFPEAGSKYLEKIWRDIIHSAARQIRHKWPGRRRKLINYNSKSNSICSIVKKEDGTWRWRHGFDPILAHEVVRQCQHHDPNELLDENDIRKIFRVCVGSQIFVVKEFKSSRHSMQLSADCLSWLINWRLEFSGFPVPKALAWFRSKDNTGYLITECIDGIPLHDALRDALNDEIKENILMRELIKLMMNLYNWGVFHETLKSNDFIVKSENNYMRIYLVDNDSAKFDVVIGNEHRQLHHRQLMKALPDVQAVKQRFAHLFAEAEGLWLY